MLGYLFQFGKHFQVIRVFTVKILLVSWDFIYTLWLYCILYKAYIAHRNEISHTDTGFCLPLWDFVILFISQRYNFNQQRIREVWFQSSTCKYIWCRINGNNLEWHIKSNIWSISQVIKKKMNSNVYEKKNWGGRGGEGITGIWGSDIFLHTVLRFWSIFHQN